MPQWPETLPQSPLNDSFRESLPQSVLRTEMDQGPAKTRQRTTAATGKISFSLLLTLAQAQALEGFFQETLAGGSLSFIFTHPRTGAAVSCRFLRPPEFTAQGGVHFRSAIELETLP